MSFFTISRSLELNLVVDQKDVRHHPASRKKKPVRKQSASDSASMGSNHSLSTSTMSRMFRRKTSKSDSLDNTPSLSESIHFATDPFDPSLSKSSSSPGPSYGSLNKQLDPHHYHHQSLSPSPNKNFTYLSGDGSGLSPSRRSSIISVASPHHHHGLSRPVDHNLHPPAPTYHHQFQNYFLSPNQASPNPVLGLALLLLLLLLLLQNLIKRGSVEHNGNSFDPGSPTTIQPHSNPPSNIIRRYPSQHSFASSHSSQHSTQRQSPRSSRRPSVPTIQTKSSIAPNPPPLPSIAHKGSVSSSTKSSSILLALQLPPFQLSPLEQSELKDHIKFKDGYSLEQKKWDHQRQQRDGDLNAAPKQITHTNPFQTTLRPSQPKIKPPSESNPIKPPSESNPIKPPSESNPIKPPPDFKPLHEAISPGPGSANSRVPDPLLIPPNYRSSNVTSMFSQDGSHSASTSPPSPHVFGSFARKSPHPRLGARQSFPPPTYPAPDQQPWLVAGKAVPRFNPHLSKGFLNSTKLSPSMASPEAQVQRFNTFMDSLLGLQWNDPVTFANIRLLSLMKFTMRHKDAKALGENPKNRNHFYYEGILSYEIINMRIFMRDMMMHASRNLTRRSCIAEDRELMQLNFVNYLAYLLQLPGELDPNQHYDEWLSKHYQHRNIFLKIAENLYTLDHSTTTSTNEGQDQQLNKPPIQLPGQHPAPLINQDKANAEKEEQNAANASISRIGPLLRAISKVAYEYNLLETYQIQIFAKFNRNLLFESGLLRALFDTHKLIIDQELEYLPKVLVFNITHSLQYIWYMCLTTPFVRVIELSILNENELLANDYDAYRAQEQVTAKHDFAPCDRDLHHSLFEKLSLGSFEEFRELPASKLVLLHRHLDNKLAKYAHVNIHEVSSPSHTFSHKPMNAGFFDQPLASIATNTFDAIQTRDLMFQLTRSNYKTIIGEFYRILKPGGILEAPLMQAGIDKLKKNIERELVANRVYQSRNATRNQWQGADLAKVLQYFDLISNFPETFLKELHAVFGPANVRYNIVLLNSCNDVNDFLFKLNTLNVSAMLGHFDDYCNELKAEMSNDSRRAMPETGLQYYVHIRAQKPL